MSNKKAFFKHLGLVKEKEMEKRVARMEAVKRQRIKAMSVFANIDPERLADEKRALQAMHEESVGDE